MGGNKWSSVGRSDAAAESRPNRSAQSPSPSVRPSVRPTVLSVETDGGRSVILARSDLSAAAARRCGSTFRRAGGRAAQNHMTRVLVRGPHMSLPILPSSLSSVPSADCPSRARPTESSSDGPTRVANPSSSPSCSAEGKGERQSELGPMIWAEIVTRSDMRSVTEH